MSLPCCYRSETNPDGCDFRRHKTSPLCLHHLFEVIRDAIYDDLMPPDVLASLRADLAGAMMERYRAGQQLDLELLAPKPPAHDPLVYYIRLSRGRIKIGTTTNLPQRMTAFRATREDLVAVEPGGFDVERQRHRQFADLVLPGRPEEFTETEALLEWTGEVAARHADLASIALSA